jgi:lipopolysaccharide transport system ATP-binding protein
MNSTLNPQPSTNSDVVIRVENLTKEYRLGTISHGTLKEDLQSWWARVRGKEDPNSIVSHPSPLIPDQGLNPHFLALDEVSFDVKKGEAVGIIGRNGAGKSTLLKILSRVTAPTSGEVKIRGRVASLLEVGTGFHPELTGRENIFLNGTILGMKRAEIQRKFDEIVAFAEVEQFIDTPVKRYSSGMYVRLAFAVAAHLEPEILIVDEVLAVGDAAFQKKCLGKMEDVSTKEGRTILFVSHNMGAISELCSRGIVLNAGKISYMGESNDAVSAYNGFFLNNELSVENCARRDGAGGIRIARVWITDSHGQRINRATPSEELNLNLEAQVDELYQFSKHVVIGFGIDSLQGQRILTCVSSWANKDIITNGEKLYVRCNLPSFPLIKDKYLVSASVSYHNDTLDYVEHCDYIEIVQDDKSFSRGREKAHGVIDLPYSFEVDNV